MDPGFGRWALGLSLLCIGTPAMGSNQAGSLPAAAPQPAAQFKGTEHTTYSGPPHPALHRFYRNILKNLRKGPGEATYISVRTAYTPVRRKMPRLGTPEDHAEEARKVESATNSRPKSAAYQRVRMGTAYLRDGDPVSAANALADAAESHGATAEETIAATWSHVAGPSPRAREGEARHLSGQTNLRAAHVAAGAPLSNQSIGFMVDQITEAGERFDQSLRAHSSAAPGSKLTDEARAKALTKALHAASSAVAVASGLGDHEKVANVHENVACVAQESR